MCVCTHACVHACVCGGIRMRVWTPRSTRVCTGMCERGGAVRGIAAGVITTCAAPTVTPSLRPVHCMRNVSPLTERARAHERSQDAHVQRSRVVVACHVLSSLPDAGRGRSKAVSIPYEPSALRSRKLMSFAAWKPVHGCQKPWNEPCFCKALVPTYTACLVYVGQSIAWEGWQ